VLRISLAVGLKVRGTGQGTNTYELCVRNIVTRLVNYPVTLCILEHFYCKLHAVIFAVGARGARLHLSTTIKRLGIQLLWAFHNKLILPFLLTARLELVIQQVVIKIRREIIGCCAEFTRLNEITRISVSDSKVFTP